MSKDFGHYIKILGVLIVACAVLVAGGPMALAADVTWDGSTDSSWIEDSNWDTNAEPVTNDDVFIEDVSPSSTCVYDRGTALTIRGLTVAGTSPTKMTLNVDTVDLTVSHHTDLEDYAELDVDQELLCDTDTNFSGDVWVDVEDSQAVYLMDRVDVVAGGTNVLHLLDNSSGTFKVDNLYIDAQAVGASTGFKLDGSGSKMTVLTLLQLKSDQGSNNYKAKLWVASGTVEIGSVSTTGQLEIDGGDAISRAAEIDQDDSLVVETTTIQSGFADIDVASGKTLYAGDIVFSSGSHSHKTGAGTVVSSTP